jgi:ferredoxin
MPKVHFLTEVVEVEAQPGDTVEACARRAGIPLFRGFWSWGHRLFGCPRSGRCGACRVWVSELAPGALSPPDRRERGKAPGATARLACRAEIRGDVEVRTQPGGPPPVRSAAWPPDPRPTAWKQRLAEKEAELAGAPAAAPAAEED